MMWDRVRHLWFRLFWARRPVRLSRRMSPETVGEWVMRVYDGEFSPPPDERPR